MNFSVLYTLYTTKGGSRHRFYMSSSQLQHVTELNWISQSISIMAIATGKVSVAVLIGRLMGPSRWRMWFLYFLSVTALLLACLCIIVIFTQCKPSKALWDPPVGKCWNPKGANDIYLAVSSRRRFLLLTHNLLTSFAGYYAAVDLSLALLPTTIIWKLKLNVRERVALTILLGFGVL